MFCLFNHGVKIKHASHQHKGKLIQTALIQIHITGMHKNKKNRINNDPVSKYISVMLLPITRLL